MKISLNPAKRFFNTFVLMASIIAISVGSNSWAAEEKAVKKAAPKSKDKFEQLSQRLQLSDKQKKELKPILEKVVKERKETMSAMQAKHDKMLSKVLNEDQMRKTQRYLKKASRVSSSRGKSEKMKKKDPKKSSDKK